MTEIRKIAPTRRAGELGIHSVDHFSLAVPDLVEGAKFYAALGLDVKAEGNTVGLYTHGNSHCWGRLIEGPRKQIAHLSFAVFEDDLPRFKKRIEENGIKLLDPPKGRESNGLWFRDNDGKLVEIRVAEKTSPNAKSAFDMISVPAGQRGAPQRSKAPFVQPKRLAHMLIFTPDVDKSLAFYSRVMGLRLADRVGDMIAFMYAIHGSDHHAMAFCKSEAPGLHHTSWDVGSVNAIGHGAMQMASVGYTKGWGAGRHVLGSNYFHYVRDPWGSYAEYTADIDYIGHDQTWDSGDYPAEDSFYVWGPEPPKDFAVNFEARS